MQLKFLVLLALLVLSTSPVSARVYIHYGHKGVIVLTNDPYYGVEYLKDVKLVKTDLLAEGNPRAWLRIPGREVAVEKGLGDAIKGFKIIKIDDRSVVVSGNGIRYRFEISDEDLINNFDDLDLFLADISFPEQKTPDVSDFMVEQTLFVNDEADSVKIRKKGSDISIKAEINDTIDGYRLAEIKKDRLVFEKDGKTHEVEVPVENVNTVNSVPERNSPADLLPRGPRRSVVKGLWGITGTVICVVLGISWYLLKRLSRPSPAKEVQTAGGSGRRQLGFRSDERVIYSGPVRISEMAPGNFVDLITHLIQRSGFLVRKKHEIGIGLAEIVAFSNHPISGGKYLVRCQASSWGGKVEVGSLEILRERMTDEEAVKGIYISTSLFSAEAVDFAHKNSIEILGLKEIVQLAERYYLGEYVA